MGLLKARPGVHVLVGVHTLAHDQFAPCHVWLVLCCDLESLRPVRRYQPVERCKQKLGAVNEAQLPEGEGNILLRVVGDTAYPTLHLRDGLHQEVGVVAPQVAEHHGDGGGFGV